MTDPKRMAGATAADHDQRSGRWSGRVESDPAAAHELPGLTPITGQESMSPAVTYRAGAEGRAKRRGGLQLRAIQRAMSDRDQAVLLSLSKLRFATTAHLELLHFTDHATPDAAARICRRVLKRLHDWRVIEHLERRVGGVRAGSQSYVWRVGPSGDRLLRAVVQAPRDRRHEPSLRFLDHTLAVTDCVIDLTAAARADQFELLDWQTEPATWHRYLGPSGSRDILKPDLYVVTGSGVYEDHWYVEIDRGTEAVPTVLKQCASYEACRRQGRLQRDIGVFPFVVWVVPDEARADKIASAIERTRGLDPANYRVVVHHQLSLLVGAGGAL